MSGNIDPPNYLTSVVFCWNFSPLPWYPMLSFCLPPPSPSEDNSNPRAKRGGLFLILWGTWWSLLSADWSKKIKSDHFSSCCSAQYVQIVVHYVWICSAHYIWIFIHNVRVVLYNLWIIVADIVCNKNTAGVQWHPSSMTSFLHPSTQIWEYILILLGGLNTVGMTI